MLRPPQASSGSAPEHFFGRAGDDDRFGDEQRASNQFQIIARRGRVRIPIIQRGGRCDWRQKTNSGRDVVECYASEWEGRIVLITYFDPERVGDRTDREREFEAPFRFARCAPPSVISQGTVHLVPATVVDGFIHGHTPIK